MKKNNKIITILIIVIVVFIIFQYVDIEEIEEVSDNENIVVDTEWDNQTRVINGNIFYRDQNLVEEQITFQNLDSRAVLSPDGKKIAFFRETPDNPIHGCWHDNSIIHEMWLYDPISKEKELLVSGGNVYAGNIEELPRFGDICKYMLAHFADLQFSLDSKTIYFSHAAWATSGAIQSVGVSTGEIKFVSSGNGGFEVIKDGEYKGDILIGSKHKYFYGGGSYDICFVVSPEGKELLAIASKDDFYNGNFFQTSKQDRDNFLNYIENEFSDIKYSDSDIKGVKRIIEKDEDEGERIFYYLTYPEIEEEIFSFTTALRSSFRDLIGVWHESIIKNSFFDGSLIYNDYEITLLKDSLLSVRFDFYEYGAGVVHEMHRTEVFNFKGCVDDSRGEFIELENIFKSDIDYLSILSEIAEKKLISVYEAKGEEYDKNLIKKATMPDSGNLEKFNLSENALIITFDADKTEFSLDERQTIEILYTEIEEYVDSNGLIGDLI